MVGAQRVASPEPEGPLVIMQLLPFEIRLPAFFGQIVILVTLIVAAPVAEAQVTAFRQAVAETAARDADLAAFYRARDFEGIWTGSSEDVQARRNAFLGALVDAGAHGLPAGRYDPANVVAMLQAATTVADQGRVEVEMSRLFLQYATDIQTGVLVPGEVITAIRREVPYRDRLVTLEDFSQTAPAAFLRSLPPASPEYTRLMREKLRLEALIPTGGWGPAVPGGALEPGASGERVVALRNRLIAMGYMERSATQTYDGIMQTAVQLFQEAHGLTQDGVVGQGTLEQVNVPIEQRLQSIIVAMERERWTNAPRGERHIWVNLVDFTAAIVDNDRVTFRTRSVIGATAGDRQTPEFSDVMEFMVINPSWYVPRSIIVNEYLPALRSNPGAHGHLEITDSSGRRVNRSAANFSGYSASSFPYAMRQPPGPRNALGVVKFMFPNVYNIYLHDTPARDLFGREVRAFSHGCIRLNDPRDFAYALLARQTDDPEGFFAERLNTGAETRVDLEVPVPVHLDYRTAFTLVTGALNFRGDVYGRDQRIWEALASEGVVIGGVQG